MHRRRPTRTNFVVVKVPSGLPLGEVTITVNPTDGPAIASDEAIFTVA